jgi:palmitoyl-protein thioesterase
MFSFIAKTLMLISVLTLKPIRTFSIFDRITMLEDSSTPTTTFGTTFGTEGINAHYPVVLLHGIDSSSQAMEPLCDWIETRFNTTVYNMEIGDGEKTSLYVPLMDQLFDLCSSIYAIDALSDGFNFIGISLGGLLARGYVERCNSFPVHNLITLFSPHGGVYWANAKNNDVMYNDFYQNNLALASYWRNPKALDTYYSSCSYLPLLNNEIWCESDSPTHRRNMRNLSNFVMIWSPLDTTVYPPESAKFSFYDEDFNVVPLKETNLYKNDALGLKYLNFLDGLHMFETNCSHANRNHTCLDELYSILKNFV